MRHAVADIYSGGTPDTSDSRYWADDDSGFAWVAIGDMTRADTVTRTEKRVTADGIADKRLRVLPAGTLLYSMYASLGKVAVLGIDATINQAILGLVPDTTRVRGDFLRYWLVSIEQHLPLFSSSNTQDNLNAAKVRSFPVFVPSLDEQRAIASFLDRETAKIDALVAEQERLMALLREKRQAVISHAVTKGLNPDAPMNASGVEWLGEIPAHWSVRRLKTCTPQVTVGIVVEPSKHYADEGVPALRSLNVKSGRIVLDDMVFLSADGHALHRKSTLQAGDLVAVRSGQPGATAVVPPSLDGCNCVDLLIIRKPTLLTSHYLASYLASDVALHQFALGSGGAIQQHFNVSTASELVIVVPPLEEQVLIQAYLDGQCKDFDELIESNASSLNLLTERRAALISAAVTGQIDVRRNTTRPDVQAILPTVSSRDA